MTDCPIRSSCPLGFPSQCRICHSQKSCTHTGCDSRVRKPRLGTFSPVPAAGQKPPFGFDVESRLAAISDDSILQDNCFRPHGRSIINYAVTGLVLRASASRSFHGNSGFAGDFADGVCEIPGLAGVRESADTLLRIARQFDE